MVNGRNVERRTILKAAGATAATLGLAATTACGGDGGTSADGTVTIRYAWWGAEDRAERINKTIALFEKKYPKIKVKTDFQPYLDFWKKFNTQASGGNPPDVFQNAIGFLRKYDAKNVLLDLSEQVKAEPPDGRIPRRSGEVRRDRRQAPRSSGRFQLDGYGHRQARLHQGGREAGDGLDLGRLRRGDEEDPRQVGPRYDSGMYGVMYLYDLYLRQNGKAFFTEEGLGFTESDLSDWWTKAKKGVEDGRYADAKKVAQIKPKSAVTGELAGGEFTWDNFTVRYTAEGKSEYALAPIPTTDGKKTGQYLGSLMLSASKRTQHPKEVAQFIDFMVHEPEVAKIMGYDRGVPATQAQYDAYKPTDEVNKAIAAYEESLVEAGVLEPITPHPNGADICESAFLRIAEELALGKRSVDEAVKQFFTESKTALGT